MYRLFLVLVFILPFQMRIYKFLKPLSLSWISPNLRFPPYFEPHADLFISDFFLIALVGWCLWKGVEKFDWSFEQKALVGFIGIGLFSIIFSAYTPCLISYWRWGHLVISAAFLYFLRSWFRTHIKTLAMVVVCSAVLECGIALPQYFLQHQIGLKVMGEPTLVSRHYTGSSFHMPKRALTSIDYYWQQSSKPGSVLRAAGTFHHANVLGGFLVFSLFMTVFLYEKSTRKKLIGAALILQILTLFTTYSRSGLFAFLGGLLIWAFLHLWQEKKIVCAARPLFVGAAAALLLFFPQIFHRGGVVSYNAQSAGSDEMRSQLHNVAALMIHDHPWFGVGFNNYLLAFAKYAEKFHVDSVAVHNIYLLIAVETGLVGLAVFLLFCAAVLLRGWQARYSLEGRTFFVIFLGFLAIGAVDYYPILQQQTRLIFFLVASLLTFFARGGLVAACPIATRTPKINPVL